MSRDAEATFSWLVEVLAQENAALKRMDFAIAVDLVTAKEAALVDVLQNPTPMPETTCTPSLLALIERVTCLADENHDLLKRAVTVQIRIVQIVANALAPKLDGTHYTGRNGWVRPYRPKPIALSKSA